MCSSNQDSKKIVLDNLYSEECIATATQVIQEAGIKK